MKPHLCLLSALLCVSFARAQAPQTPMAPTPLELTTVPLLIEFRPTILSKAPSVNLRIRESSTGAQASVTLNARAGSGVYDGLFVVQFARGDHSDKVLEFNDGKGNTLFTYQKPQGRFQSVKLFEKEEQWKKTVEAEEAAAAATPAPAAPAKPVAKPRLPTPAEIAKAQQAEREKARREEQARLDLERQEALKREEALRAQAEMSAAQKRQREQESMKFSNEGLAAYKAGDLKQAAELFQKAVELDPTNDTAYHQYGVTLYKLGQYNKSLAMLSMAEGEQEHKLERSYYTGLDQMKLKQYEPALKEFKDLRDENDPELSPISSFFAGTIEYQAQNYTDARKSFEFVLDNSKDPALDTQSEQMLDQIDKVESFLAASKERFRLSFTGGLINDTNVLSVAKENLATDGAAWRANYGGSILANLFRSYPTELGAQLAVNDYYSVDSGFKPDANLQLADALEYSLALPFKTQADTSARAYFFEVTPVMKSLWMAPTGGAREEIDSATALSANVTTSLNALWMVRANVEGGSDKFKLPFSSADDDQSGTHTSYGVILTRLLDLKGSKSLSGDLTLTDNASNGRNNQYKKSVLGVTFGFPGFKESIMSLRLDSTSQNYGNAVAARTDKITTVTLSSATALSKRWNMALSAVGSKSDSDQTLYVYDKFMASAIFTYTFSVLKN